MEMLGSSEYVSSVVKRSGVCLGAICRNEAGCKRFVGPELSKSDGFDVGFSSDSISADSPASYGVAEPVERG
jgi:hypothetical protein